VVARMDEHGAIWIYARNNIDDQTEWRYISSVIVDGNFQHIVITINYADDITLYVNNVKQIFTDETDAYESISEVGTDNFLLSENDNGNSRAPVATMGYFRIWNNIVLSEDNVRILFNNRENKIETTSLNNNEFVFSNYNSLNFQIYQDNSASDVNSLVEKSSWTHIVTTTDNNGNMKLYKDGKLDVSGNGYLPNLLTRSYHYIGKSTLNWDYQEYFNGIIAYFRWWDDTALSADEVFNLYTNRKNQYETPSSLNFNIDDETVISINKDEGGTINSNKMVTNMINIPYDDLNTECWKIQRKVTSIDQEPSYAWDFSTASAYSSSTNTYYYDYVNNIKAVATNVKINKSSGRLLNYAGYIDGAYFDGTAGITLNSDGKIITGGQSETIVCNFLIDPYISDEQDNQRLFVFYDGEQQDSPTSKYNYDCYIRYHTDREYKYWDSDYSVYTTGTRTGYFLYFDTGHEEDQIVIDLFEETSNYNTGDGWIFLMITLNYISADKVTIKIWLGYATEYEITTKFAQPAKVRTMNLGHRNNDLNFHGFIKNFQIWQGYVVPNEMELWYNRFTPYPILKIADMAFSKNGNVSIGNDIVHNNVKLNVFGSLRVLGGNGNYNGLIIDRKTDTYSANHITNRHYNITVTTTDVYSSAQNSDGTYTKLAGFDTLLIGYNTPSGVNSHLKGEATARAMLLTDNTFLIGLDKSGFCSYGQDITIISCKYNFNRYETYNEYHLLMNPNGTLKLNSFGGNNMTFCTTDVSGNSSEIMTLDTNGNVGIGTDSPAYTLDVSGDARINAGVLYLEAGTLTDSIDEELLTNAYIKFGAAGTGTDWAYLRQIGGNDKIMLALDFHDNTGDAGFVIRDINSTGNGAINTRFIVDRGGNVGIGTDSPESALHVTGQIAIAGSASQGVHLGTNGEHSGIEVVSSESGNSYIDFSTPDEDYQARIIYQPGNDAFCIINTGYGNVGINTASPQQMLHVNGNILAGGDLYIGGYVGIGTTSSDYPLEVIGQETIPQTQTNYQIVDENYYNFNNTAAYVSAKFQHDILCDRLFAYSDKRIKKNITDISDSEALDILRLLKPKKYEYIDAVNSKYSQAYGYIAQEVKEVLPVSVSTVADYIPNIYKLADVLFVDNQYILKFNNYDTSNLDSSISDIRLIDISGNNHHINIHSIIDNDSIMIKEDISNVILYENKQIFVYGQKVDDFHVLHDNYIHVLNVSAVQELDREVIKLKQEKDALQASHDTLQASHDTLQASHDSLQTSHDSLKDELAELKQENNDLKVKTNNIQTELTELKTLLQSKGIID
jgi:hypothetical protein